MSDSFLLTNMIPQAPLLNRGLWADLEKQVREWAKERGTVYVITGHIYRNKNLLGPNKVGIPDAVFKLVFDPVAKETIAIVADNKGFIQKKDKTGKQGFLQGLFATDKSSQDDSSLYGLTVTLCTPLPELVVPLNRLEQMTGLTFFTKLPPDTRKKLYQKSDWSFNKMGYLKKCR